MSLKSVKTELFGTAEFRSPAERKTMLLALELFGQSCIAAIQSGLCNEDQRLEFAVQYDEARTLSERIAGIT